MALIGRLYGIMSERRLCHEVRFNLAYRWFCRLPLDADVPHHSTFSKNRHGGFRHAGVFRLRSEQTIRRAWRRGWSGARTPRSTDDQDFRLQRAALKEAGCRRTFQEKLSGAKRDRPELARMLDQLRDDDVVVVTRLDRLARSTKDLLDIAEKLKDAGAGLRSLAEPWADTTSAAGRMVLTVFAGIAEFERELIYQRTSNGRVAAKVRAVYGSADRPSSPLTRSR
jgi:hypothetical protein